MSWLVDTEKTTSRNCLHSTRLAVSLVAEENGKTHENQTLFRHSCAVGNRMPGRGRARSRQQGQTRGHARNHATTPSSKAAAEVIASGELTGKSCEVTLLHHPPGLKAKRLLRAGRRQGTVVLRIRTAPRGWNRRAHAQVARLAQLRLCRFRRLGYPRIRRSRPSWKAPSSATSTPTPTRAIARTRKSTNSPSSQMATAGKLQSALERSARHRRIAELHPRPGQRTIQPHDPDHPRRARQADGAGSRPEVRGLWR